MRETKLDRLKTRGTPQPEIVEAPRERAPEPFVAGAGAKALVEEAHVAGRKPDHEGTKQLPPGPWHGMSRAEIAEAARDEQLALGDRLVTDWRRKVAQLHAHPEISGSIAGIGVGDIVDRLHEGLATANTLIRSFDLDDERFARAEFGPAPSPISCERVRQIADKELARLHELGEAQVRLELRKAPHHPLVRDRALFALGRAAAISADGGEVWLALKYLPSPGAAPEEITVHARLLGEDFRAKKAAIETLGINLLHGTYFRSPGELAQALLEDLPKGTVSIDFLESSEVRIGEQPPVKDWPHTEPPRAEVGADRRALYKAQQLNDRGGCSGVIAEIGGSQLVAELFRRATGSGKTLIERKSNYGMELSAFVYGKTARAVSKERLLTMLDHELVQFSARARDTGLSDRKLFAYANTVATKSGGLGAGWLGIDFQTVPGGPPNRIVLHARMLSEEVPDQELALKTLGINLIHATQLRLDPSVHGMRTFLDALTDGIPRDRIAIDTVEHTGPDLERWQADTIRIELLKSELTNCLLFTAAGERKTTLDHFYQRKYVVRPDRDLGDANLVHLDLRSFEKRGFVDEAGLLSRIAELNREGRDVIVTRRPELRELIQILARSANAHQTIVVSRAELRRFCDPKHWIKVEGGMEALLEKLSCESLKLKVLPGDEPMEPNSAAGQRMLALLRARGVVE